ncbi:hypothetical protein VB715_20670 [Crocosphaera sp. UHCC 0190]|uniref:hypothetical protein n=1 Tax=Crocosphaera sp. UHCC 0190 TaxID=3110246 RepID=UPI002B204BF9|nr:hypothetical protein [Crocosphaera sp. UHCC 0190]MEA5512191.1 hypothetical protein [Crocosphaera sp. UHCC 0190]
MTMNLLQLINYILPALISMMLLSMIVASLPAVLANDSPTSAVEEVQPLEKSTGNLQDLQGLEYKNSPPLL